MIQVNSLPKKLSDHCKEALAAQFVEVWVIITVAEIGISLGSLVKRIGGRG